MKKHLPFYFIIILIAVAGLAFDLITKSLATGVTGPLISGVIGILFTWNTGAGWSLLSDQTLLLTIFSGLLVIGLICLIIFYRPRSKLFSVGTGLVLAGALGNLFDRVFFGAVRDFLCLEFINFPIFNVADVLLTAGAIVIGVWLVFFWEKGKNKNEPNS